MSLRSSTLISKANLYSAVEQTLMIFSRSERNQWMNLDKWIDKNTAAKFEIVLCTQAGKNTVPCLIDFQYLSARNVFFSQIHADFFEFIDNTIRTCV